MLKTEANPSLNLAPKPEHDNVRMLWGTKAGINPKRFFLPPFLLSAQPFFYLSGESLEPWRLNMEVLKKPAIPISKRLRDRSGVMAEPVVSRR
jgi:hypothetical protein